MVMGAHGALLVRRPTRSTSLRLFNLRFLDLLFLLLAFSLSSSGGFGVGGAIITAAAEVGGGGGGGGGDSSLHALLDFKSSLSNADALTNWDPSSKTNPCSDDHVGEVWTGVLCFNGNVWGLQLENKGLGGEIDIDSLLPLPQLRTLSFMGNNFEGPLPDFRKLGALKSLFLSNNHFSGDIPDDAFMGMSYLKKVYLANNKFTGKIPTSLAKSPRLLELRLENNQFIGPIPDFPPDLKLINVSNNQLEGPIPPSLTDMDANFFSGNKELCGKPLNSICKTSAPSICPPDETSSNAPPAGVTGEEKKPSALRIVVMVIAGLVALVAMVVILIACCRRLGGGNRKSKLSGSLLSPSQRAGLKRDQSSGGGAVGTGNGMNVRRSGNGGGGKDQHGRLTFMREDRQRFELQDLLRASAEVLGSGSFGSSYKAVLMDPEGQAVVVKRFKQMNKVVREDFQEHMRRLGRLSHPNLLPIVAYYYRKEEKLLVFDFIPNGSLATQLHGNHSADRPGLDWPIRLKIIKGVAKGLAYLHSELPSLNVPHGHLKSSNVLLDKSFEPLLMDYALVPVVNPEQAQQLMVAYKSPEHCQHNHTTKKTDVWSLGILILETLTGKFPSNYLANTSSTTTAAAGADLLSDSSSSSSSSSNWVKSIVPNTTSSSSSGEEEEEEEVIRKAFDKEMGGSTKNAHGEMLKLLRIGVACCEDDLEARLDLKEATDKIDLINERDHPNPMLL